MNNIKAKKRVEDFTIIENKRLNKEFFILKLKSAGELPVILPGQFAEVRIDDNPTTFLRRPISIYNVDYSGNTIELLIKIAGDGTKKLSELKDGGILNIVYPLGNSFSKPAGTKVLLIGGGTGVAPMLILGKYMKANWGIEPLFLLGYRSDKLIIEKERFEALGKVYITTEDGSDGYKGFVTQHPILNEPESNFDIIYTCGPEIMMKAIAKKAKELNSACEVSLENLMGCGIGACLCCIVDTKDKGNVNTCTEGPVFNSERLKWQI
ncbi:MAG: dihydroorotate dehydrogenase electron transfer subunit [Bacteroidales bacterium]|nr:dihydroorotate dehydrogenase electron transfer subunit [Bacteroidales bacterium]MBN2820193.1 dihydroorotate dehydrogenase electron transfer subunit [Bacteroidales bacterium]